jgi:hypothetical protein
MASVHHSVRHGVHHSVHHSVHHGVHHSVHHSVRQNVRHNVHDNVRDIVRKVRNFYALQIMGKVPPQPFEEQVPLAVATPDMFKRLHRHLRHLHCELHVSSTGKGMVDIRIRLVDKRTAVDFFTAVVLGYTVKVGRFFKDFPDQKIVQRFILKEHNLALWVAVNWATANRALPNFLSSDPFSRACHKALNGAKYGFVPVQLEAHSTEDGIALTLSQVPQSQHAATPHVVQMSPLALQHRGQPQMRGQPMAPVHPVFEMAGMSVRHPYY